MIQSILPFLYSVLLLVSDNADKTEIISFIKINSYENSTAICCIDDMYNCYG